MKDTILRLLNIRPSESWLVRNLFFVQLFQGIGIAFLLTSSNALFLVQFDIQELPRVFIISGVILLLINYLYTKLEHHIPIQKLIIYILLFSAATVLLLRLMIYTFQLAYASYILIIWYQVVYLLCGAAFWALAALIFDVRESKRTFGILSAGDLPAKFLGYLAVYKLAPIIGLSNLLFISVGCFILSALAMQNILISRRIDFRELHEKSSHQEVTLESKATRPIEIFKSVFGNNLIFLIAILTFIVVVALTVIDFTFLSGVKQKYKSDVELAKFLGMFLAIGRLLAIIAKATLTSRIIQRLGVSASLMILPALLFAFTIFILLAQQLGSNPSLYLYFFGIMAVLTEVLKSTIQDPLSLVLFQPLKPVVRLKGHIITKGIMVPIALLMAGIFIYLNIRFVGAMHINTTSYFLIALCLIWAFLVYLLNRQYLASLIDSLKSGFFRGNLIIKNDAEVRQLLLEKMQSPKSLDVVYAADTLEKIDAIAFGEALLPLLEHPDKDIRKYGLKKIAEHNLKAAIPELKQLLIDETDEDFKLAIIKTLSHLQEDHSELINQFLDHPNIEIQQDVVTALFSSGDIMSIMSAGQKLTEWMNSTDPAARMRAAHVISLTADKNFYASLIKLMNDSDPDVQKQAIIAASHIRNVKLIPHLVEKLKDPVAQRRAVTALAAQGEAALEYFSQASMMAAENMESKLIRIAALVGGGKAHVFLLDWLLKKPAFRHEIIEALKETNYSAPDHLEPEIATIIKSGLDDTNKIISDRNFLGKTLETKLLSDALMIELKNHEASIFYLLSFIYDRRKILRAYENILSGKKERIANATEVIELVVPKKLSGRVISLVEHLNGKEHPVQSKLVSTNETIPLLKQITLDAEAQFNAWTRSVAMYSLHLIKPDNDFSFLKTVHTNGNYIVEETRDYILAKHT